MKKLVTWIVTFHIFTFSSISHAGLFGKLFGSAIAATASYVAQSVKRSLFGDKGYVNRDSQYAGGSQYESLAGRYASQAPQMAEYIRKEKKKYRKKAKKELQRLSSEYAYSAIAFPSHPIPESLDFYIAQDKIEYEVQYFIARLFDLSTSKESPAKAVETFLSDRVVSKFIAILLNPKLDLTPLIKSAAFEARIVEKAKGQNPSAYIRNGFVDMLVRHKVHVISLRNASYNNQLTQTLEKISDADFIQEEVAEFFDSIGLSIRAVTKSINDPSLGFGKEGDKMIETMKTIVNAYFDNLPAEKKQQLSQEFAKLKNPTEIDIVAFALLHSGPGMQKLVQLFYQNMQSPALKAALKQAEENIDTMPFEKVKRIVTSELRKQGLEFEQIFSDFSPKPLKAGTVAQVHEATVRYTNQTGHVKTKHVAVKVRREDYRMKLESDIFILQNAGIEAQFDNGIFGQAFQSMRAEGDFQIEGQNIIHGQVYDNPQLKVESVKLALPHVLPPTESLLVLEFVDGGYSVGDSARNSLNELKSRNEALTNTFRAWFVNALAKDGFFHADPNGGNIKVRPNGNGVLLDYGNVGTLSSEQQKAILGLIDAAMDANVKTMTSSLQTLLPGLARFKSEDLEHEVSRALNAGGLTEIFNGLFEIGTRRSVMMPMNLAQFLRGLMLFKAQFDFIHDQVKEKGPLEADNQNLLVERDFQAALGEAMMDLMKAQSEAKKAARAQRGSASGMSCQSKLTGRN